MARANPFDPKTATNSVTVQYVTPTSTSPAFRTAYGEANQTLLELSNKGTKVQAGSLASW